MDHIPIQFGVLVFPRDCTLIVVGTDWADADLVYVPLKLLWAVCNDDVRETLSIFMAHMKIFLPLLDYKPHFVSLSRVAHWNGIDVHQLKDSSVTILTIDH